MKKLAVLLAAALAIGGCADDGSGPGDDAAGTYELISVNGAILPVVFEENGVREEVQSGVLQLNTNGTFTVTFNYRVTENGAVTNLTETENGTWTESGNTVTVVNSDGEQSGATRNGDRLTVTGG